MKKYEIDFLDYESCILGTVELTSTDLKTAMMEVMLMTFPEGTESITIMIPAAA